MDWLDGFRDDPTIGRVSAAFEDAFDNPNSDPEGAIAAAEVVAFLCDRPSTVSHEELEDLSRIELPSELCSDAALALERVLNTSWLRKSWEETNNLTSWISEIVDLQQRLTKQ